MDDELLVNYVKEYPFLYDKRLKEYKNKDKKESTWYSIALSLGCDVEDVKYRWKCLRDRYVRESKVIKSLKHGTPVSRSKYPHYFMLSFLKNTIIHRVRLTYRKSDRLSQNEIRANETNKEPGDTNLAVDYNQMCNNYISFYNKNIDSYMNSPAAEDEDIKKHTTKKLKKSYSDDKNSDSDLDSTSETNLNSISDDEHFLLSLRMSLSAITDEKRKNSLKIDILNLINNYLE